MIREKSILCKLNLINISDKQIFDSFIQSDSPCPGCGADGCRACHGSYERYMVTMEESLRVDYRIEIKRVKCGSCGKTHALLPDILIPFGSYALRFVLTVLRAYLVRNTTVESLCESFAISISTLYKWIHLFREHANLLLPALEQLAWVARGSIECLEGIEALPSFFFGRYRFSFLQNHGTTACQR